MRTVERLIKFILCLVPVYFVTAFCNGYSKRLYVSLGYSEDAFLGLKMTLISYGVPALVFIMLLKFWVFRYKKQK